MQLRWRGEGGLPFPSFRRLLLHRLLRNDNARMGMAKGNEVCSLLPVRRLEDQVRPLLDHRHDEVRSV